MLISPDTLISRFLDLFDHHSSRNMAAELIVKQGIIYLQVADLFVTLNLPSKQRKLKKAKRNLESFLIA